MVWPMNQSELLTAALSRPTDLPSVFALCRSQVPFCQFQTMDDSLGLPVIEQLLYCNFHAVHNHPTCTFWIICGVYWVCNMTSLKNLSRVIVKWMIVSCQNWHFRRRPFWIMKNCIFEHLVVWAVAKWIELLAKLGTSRIYRFEVIQFFL